MCFHGEQDIRRDGGFTQSISFYHILVLLFGSCSLYGLPFYFRLLFKRCNFWKPYSFFMLIIHGLHYFYACSGINVYCQHYSVRLIIFSLFWYISVRVDKIMKKQLKVRVYFYCLPLIILSFFSIFIGYLTRVSFYWIGVLLFGVSSILNLLFLCCWSWICSSFLLKWFLFLFSCIGWTGNVYLSFIIFCIQFLSSIACSLFGFMR
jgi:hypothetical protein